MISGVHRRAVEAAGGQVVGVLGSSPERSSQLASEWGVDGFASLDSLLASEADVVHVCSPNATHVDYAAAALRAGKHVICEKPIATTAADAERLVAIAEESELVATVPFVYRYHPIVRELRSRRRRGDFGEMFAVHGSYLQDWMLSPGAANWRIDAAAGGRSRAFADIGSHWCDLVEFVSGERFSSLTAVTSVAIPRRPDITLPSFSSPGETSERVEVATEDIAMLLLSTDRGGLGNVTVSQVAGGRRNRLWFELDGAQGSAVFDQESPETAWLGTPEGATIIARGAGPLSDEQARLSYLPGGHAQGYQDCFDAFVADTFATIRGEAPDGLPTLVDGLRAARLVEAVLVSAGSGEWTRIEEEPGA